MARNKVSSKAMAAHCGVTPGAVSAWFSTGRISKGNLLKVAELLAMDVAALISGEPGAQRRSTATSVMLESAPPITPAALQLAQIYDWLTDPIDREIVRNLTTQAVLERLSRVSVASAVATSSTSPATHSSGKPVRAGST